VAPAATVRPPAAAVATPATDARHTSDLALKAALDEYYQQAKASGETKVTWYGIGDEYRLLAEVFNLTYPGIMVEPVLLRGPEMIQRISAEHASGQYIANLAATGLTTMSELERLGRLVQWDPPNAAKLPPPEGGSDHYRWMYSVSLFGMVVNTDLVPADKVPKSRLDLLDPFFNGKGKLLSEDPRAAGAGQSFWVLALDDLGLDFFERIKAQGITFVRDRDAAPLQIARGEFMVYLAYNINVNLQELQKNAPVKAHFFTDGGAHFTDITAGLVKGAPGQAAAKLWVSWLTSEEGQQALVDKLQVYPALEGIPAPAGLPTFAEVRPKSRTNAQRERNDEYIKTFERVFFS
jgi:iron(III) transport system substrate-binding protein